MEQLGLEQESFGSRALGGAAQAKSEACKLAWGWAQRYPAYANRIRVADAEWCSGEIINGFVSDWPRHILAPNPLPPPAQHTQRPASSEASAQNQGDQPDV